MSADYEPVVKQLIKTVVRIFYEPQHVAITDILLESVLLSDTEFCAKMKMLNREFNRLIVRLKEDHLVKYDIKVEVQEDGKQLLKTVYFFNYSEAKDIIKYKIYKMTKLLEDKLRVTGEQYYCGECDRVFSALDAQACMDGFVFHCVHCNSELVEYTAKLDESDVDLKELMGCLRHVITLLKEVDTYKIPTLDYFQILELKKERDAASSPKPQTKPAEAKPAVPELSLPESRACEDTGAFENAPAANLLRDQQRAEPAKDEAVYVNGVKRKFSEITEEDKEAMDEDEYTRYFEIHARYN
ncbi:transcription initiation factor TFIIE subunit alpha [Pancytospora philotis]|nr:transcription initiation factor TFIIE subunit alpha [Pancytospora philotis]